MKRNSKNNQNRGTFRRNSNKNKVTRPKTSQSRPNSKQSTKRRRNSTPGSNTKQSAKRRRTQISNIYPKDAQQLLDIGKGTIGKLFATPLLPPPSQQKAPILIPPPPPPPSQRKASILMPPPPPSQRKAPILMPPPPPLSQVKASLLPPPLSQKKASPTSYVELGNNEDGYPLSLHYMSNNEELFNYARRFIRQNIKAEDGTFPEGIYEIFFTVNEKKENIMIIIYFDKIKVVSDCGHDFNGTRGDKDIASRIKANVLGFFKISSFPHDDKELSNNINNYVENRSDIFQILGPKPRVADDSLQILSRLHDILNTEIKKSSKNSAEDSFKYDSKEEDEFITGDAPGLTSSQLDEFRKNNPIEVLSEELDESFEKPLYTKEYQTRPLKTIVDNGVSNDFKYDKFQQMTGTKIQEIYDQDKYNVNIKIDNENGYTHFIDFKLAGIAMSSDPEKDTSIFIEHLVNGVILNLKKEWLYVYDKNIVKKDFVTPPNVDELTQEVKRGGITEIQAELAKFLGDHSLSSSYLLHKAGCFPKSIVSVYGVTHDLRSFRDNVLLELFIGNKMVYVKTPTIYSGTLKTKTQYLVHTGVTDEGLPTYEDKTDEILERISNETKGMTSRELKKRKKSEILQEYKNKFGYRFVVNHEKKQIIIQVVSDRKLNPEEIEQHRIFQEETKRKAIEEAAKLKEVERMAEETRIKKEQKEYSNYLVNDFNRIKLDKLKGKLELLEKIQKVLIGRDTEINKKKISILEIVNAKVEEYKEYDENTNTSDVSSALGYLNKFEESLTPRREFLNNNVEDVLTNINQTITKLENI